MSEPSLDPSSTTMICNTTGSSTARMRRMTSATVVRSLKTGTITVSVRYVRGGGTSVRSTSVIEASSFSLPAKYSIVRSIPSRRPVVGSHPSAVRARVMSGQRRVGSSSVGVRTSMPDDDPVTSSTNSARLEHGALVGVADVHGPRER